MRAIIGIGASLGITITAEGIETDTDLAHVKAVGCDQGQGYLFSKACPQADLLGCFAARAAPGRERRSRLTARLAATSSRRSGRGVTGAAGDAVGKRQEHARDARRRRG